MNLASDPDVHDALRSQYREKGYVHLRGLFSFDEIARMQEEADRVQRIEGIFGDRSRSHVRYSELRVDRIGPVIDISPLFAEMATGPRMLALVDTLLGGPSQLLKEKFIVKPPGDRGYGAHQDIAYWQELGFAGENVLTIALCVDACTAQNGAVEFIPGCHHRLLTAPGAVADLDQSLLPAFELIPAEAGDIILFSSLTPHRSGRNRSAEQRRVLFLTYVRDSRPGMYEYYQRVRESFLVT